MRGSGSRREATQDDLGESAAVRDDRVYGDCGGPLHGEAVDTRGDCRKADRGGAGVGSHRQGTTVATGEQSLLVASTPMPYRSDRMNHEPGWEVEARGQLGVARFTAIEEAASLEKPRACRAVDRAIDTAAAQQARIGGIDDRVEREARNIALDDLDTGQISTDPALTDQTLAECPAVTPASARNVLSSPDCAISRTISQPPTNSPLT